MKKLYILAALLMATTSAHAGGMTLQINGERIRVEAPRNCNALSCIKITAPGYNGTLGKIDLKGLGSKSKDDDVADTTPAQPAPAPAPVPATAPAPAAPVAAPTPPAPAPTTVASTAPVQSEAAPPAPPPAPAAVLPRPRPSPAPVAAAAAPTDLAARHLVHRGQQGQRSHRGMRRQSVRLCRQRREDPDQHEAAGQQVDRPHPRSRQRPQLQLDDRAEGHQYPQGPGLRLRRHVLRRPDLEARELTFSPQT